jgi:hypothetical protein
LGRNAGQGGIDLTISDMSSIALAIAGVGSLLYISRQVNVARQQAKGQFLLTLDGYFEKLNEITARLLNEEDYKPVGRGWGEIWQLMSLYERINIMVEDKIIDIAIVDRLYGFRLLAIVANDAIFQRVQSMGAEWQDFIDLCHAVAKHRRRKNPSPNDAVFFERVQSLDKQLRAPGNPWKF